jgi:hypothetical protein
VQTVKYRLFEPRPAPRRTKLEVPGWGGKSEPRRDGSHEQAWHCMPFNEGAQYGRARDALTRRPRQPRYIGKRDGLDVIDQHRLRRYLPQHPAGGARQGEAGRLLEPQSLKSDPDSDGRWVTGQRPPIVTPPIPGMPIKALLGVMMVVMSKGVVVAMMVIIGRWVGGRFKRCRECSRRSRLPACE